MYIHVLDSVCVYTCTFICYFYGTNLVIILADESPCPYYTKYVGDSVKVFILSVMYTQQCDNLCLRTINFLSHLYIMSMYYTL